MKTQAQIEAKIEELEALKAHMLEKGIPDEPFPIQCEINILLWVLGKNG